jgi:bifunctional DNA-binding transcriptional regulator/antitoxin component of YhaV-PrlF toxin-antitoxin module
MVPITTTVHESVPVTVPAEVAFRFKVKPGDRLSRSVEGSELVVRRGHWVDSALENIAWKVHPRAGAEKQAPRPAARFRGYPVGLTCLEEAVPSHS